MRIYTRQMRVKFEPHVDDELRALAEEWGITPPEAVRMCVREVLDRRHETVELGVVNEQLLRDFAVTRNVMFTAMTVVGKSTGLTKERLIQMVQSSEERAHELVDDLLAQLRGQVRKERQRKAHLRRDVHTTDARGSRVGEHIERERA